MISVVINDLKCTTMMVDEYHRGTMTDASSSPSELASSQNLAVSGTSAVPSAMPPSSGLPSIADRPTSAEPADVTRTLTMP